MAITETVAPSVEPLLPSEVKNHLRISDSGQVPRIDAIIASARQIAEDFSRRAFIHRTMRLDLKCFPQETGARSDHIKLPFPPLSEVSSLVYLEDSAGTATTWASTNYIVDTTAEPGRVYRAYEVSWPNIRQQHNAVQITYVTGHTSASSLVPQKYKSAMLMICERLWEDRGDYVVGTVANSLPMTAKDILRPTRDWRFV